MQMQMRATARIGLELGGLVAALTFSSQAEACKPALAKRWEVAPQVDGGTSPPAAPMLAEVSVRRGVGPEGAGCGQQVSSSCDDIGFIGIRLTPSADDLTPATGIGYKAFLVAGSPPGGLRNLGETVLLASDNTWMFHWIDGNTDSQEAIDFTLVFVAVDAAGNESEPSMEIRIQHGGDEAGCTTKHRRSSSPVGWLLPGVVALVLLGRRAVRP